MGVIMGLPFGSFFLPDWIDNPTADYDPLGDALVVAFIGVSYAITLSLPLLLLVRLSIGRRIGIKTLAFFSVSTIALWVLASGFLVLALTDEQGKIGRFLRLRPLRTLGKISYGVYVFHWPMAFFLRRHWPSYLNDRFWLSQLLFLLIVGFVSTGVAWLSFRYYESTILRLKEKFAPIRNLSKIA